MKALIANTHTEISYMGAFSTKMHKYAEKSLLKTFSVSTETHFAVPIGSGSTGAFERLH